MTRYDFKVHPLADLFPMMSPEEFKKLKDDMRRNGQLQPIVLDRTGEILLDGRNRLKVCRELGIDPLIEKRGDRPGTALGFIHCSDGDFIWSQNILRRHLDEDQRAAIAQKWSDTEKEAAKERQRQNLKRGDVKPEVLDSSPRGKTRELLAKKADVSTHKIQQVEMVAKHKPELLPKIESGEVKLKDAVKEIKTKPEPRIFDEQFVLSCLLKEWEVSVEKHWPKNRELTPVIRKVYALATYFEKLQKVRSAELQKKVQAVGVGVQ
jgi:hypothetical protein